MLSRMRLKTKLLLTGLLLSLVPLTIIGGIIATQEIRMKEVAGAACTDLALADLDHIANNIYAMCKSQHDVVQQMVDTGLQVAFQTMRYEGHPKLGDEYVSWSAVNQFTNAASGVELPKMMIGDVWLGQNSSGRTTSPLVDQVHELAGGTCTVFQRMNTQGDMLRVSTNVMKADGQRAIGSYIPHTNPDGTPNPVVSALLSGQTYRGRAYVVDRWYITAYEPMKDERGDIMGALYFGVPMESTQALRQAIMAAQVGQTGYVFVLDSDGNYVISKDGKRDGESIWDAKDATGRHFIQDMCRTATELSPREIGEDRYSWLNAGDSEPRMKITRLKYYEPWDWVIGVGSYMDEFFAAEEAVSDLSHHNMIMLGIVIALATLASVVTWMLVAGKISQRINLVTRQLDAASIQVTSAAEQIAETSQQTAGGASEQASSLQELTANLHQISHGIQQNAQNAQQTNDLSDESEQSARQGAEAMEKVLVANNEIRESSNETAKIIKTIDEIAFQTNLLALNAAVEAARAGDAGKGFAVVAEEVRNLAQRSAEAAKNTSELIATSQARAEHGVKSAKEVGEIFDRITESVVQVSRLVDEVAHASSEQSHNIEQINSALGQLDSVTQSNAASAEESAAAGEELSGQANELQGMVKELMAIVSGQASNFDGNNVAESWSVGGASSGSGSTSKNGLKVFLDKKIKNPSTSGTAFGSDRQFKESNPFGDDLDEVLTLEDDELIEI